MCVVWIWIWLWLDGEWKGRPGFWPDTTDRDMLFHDYSHYIRFPFVCLVWTWTTTLSRFVCAVINFRMARVSVDGDVFYLQATVNEWTKCYIVLVVPCAVLSAVDTENNIETNWNLITYLPSSLDTMRKGLTGRLGCSSDTRCWCFVIK